ncbi:hypothetical protein E2C01_093622 [Portunus trituberculatus]|uniref:Uncharacterized protein n=1 Tax=Portunus trituberculatus TaxID=210409 RepID=A0A5B7JJM3_PORTR|nr:hypothetical protein [Portunus trituberculatus]
MAPRCPPLRCERYRHHTEGENSLPCVVPWRTSRHRDRRDAHNRRPDLKHVPEAAKLI